MSLFLRPTIHSLQHFIPLCRTDSTQAEVPKHNPQHAGPTTQHRQRLLYIPLPPVDTCRSLLSASPSGPSPNRASGQSGCGCEGGHASQRERALERSLWRRRAPPTTTQCQQVHRKQRQQRQDIVRAAKAGDGEREHPHRKQITSRAVPNRIKNAETCPVKKKLALHCIHAHRHPSFPCPCFPTSWKVKASKGGQPSPPGLLQQEERQKAGREGQGSKAMPHLCVLHI